MITTSSTCPVCREKFHTPKEMENHIFESSEMHHKNFLRIRVNKLLPRDSRLRIPVEIDHRKRYEWISKIRMPC